MAYRRLGVRFGPAPGEWFPGVELVATEGQVEALRRVKDAGELARLARAADIADAALAAVRPMLGEGPREIDFGRALDFEMRRLGASGPSFETIVASGPNAAKPHHRPSERRIGPGEPVPDQGEHIRIHRGDHAEHMSVRAPVPDRAAQTSPSAAPTYARWS